DLKQTIRSKVISAEDCWPVESFRTYQQVIEETDSDKRYSILESFLCQRIKSMGWHENVSIAQTILLINQFRGNISVKELAATLRICTRTLERRFLREMGISPKAFCKVRQFYYAFRQLVLTNKSVIDVAYEAGYYDQSHFLHHFQKICGLSPGKFFEKHKNFLCLLNNYNQLHTKPHKWNSIGKLFIF